MKLLVVLFALLALALAGNAQAATSYGAPPELAGYSYPEPRVFLESQDWWQESGFNAATPSLADFAFGSIHVHLGVNFPLHEAMVLPPPGSAYHWDYLGQLHEQDPSGVTRRVRGGGFQELPSGLGTIPYDPASQGIHATSDNVRFAGQLPSPVQAVDAWRQATPGRNYENRFTLDTTSRFGKREYQSTGWSACPGGGTCPAGGLTARGWYEGPGYTNVTLRTAVSAHTLAAGDVLQPGSTVSYSLAQGAVYGFALVDADIHHGLLGLVAKPLTKATSGSFVMPALTPGDHVLLIGGIEPVAGGKANGGILRVPFHVR